MSAIEPISGNVRPTPVTPMPRVTVAQLFLRAVRRWQRNRAIAEFSRLDDRQLEDIGLSRNDIPMVAADLFRPETRSGGRAPARAPERMWQAA